MTQPAFSKKRLIFAACALTALGFAAFVWRNAFANTLGLPLPAADFSVVAKRSFPMEVIASGRLEAKHEIQIGLPQNSNGRDQVTIAEVVPEGTVVKKGDVVCRLNTKELVESENRLKLAAAAARTALATAEQTLEIERENCANTEKTTADKWDAAKVELEQWEKGTDIQKTRDLTLGIETAQRELNIAKRENANNKALFSKQFVSQSDLEKSDIALLNAVEKLESAKLAGHIYENFTRKKERREKELAIGQAALDNAHAKKQTASKLAQCQTTLDGHRNTLQLTENELLSIQSAIKDSTLLAPQNGIVIYAESRWGRRIAPGATLWIGQQFLSLPDTSQMAINLRIHEAQVEGIRVGQDVSVAISARPGRLYMGKVTKKADTAEANQSNAFLSEYEVKVDLPKDIDNDLKPGMSCRGTVATGEVKDTLTIPVQAVFAEGSVRHCWVDAGGGKVRRREIKTAQAGSLYAAVASGLQPGERVLLRAPLPDEIVK